MQIIGLPIGLTSVLHHQYSLAEIQEVRPVTAGFLSQNWVLQTARGSFFLKQYRFTAETRIHGVHASKFFFAEAGVPVVLPLVGRNGRSFFLNAHNNKFYALFPFVAARQPQRGALTHDELTHIATQLAKLHRVGQGKKIAGLPTVSQVWRRQNFSADAAKILAIIQQKRQKTPFDQLAAKKIRLKQTLADKIHFAYADLGLVHDCLIHGDYHTDNLFVDEDGAVTAVFDWEKSGHSHRLLELIRSAEFSCFSPSQGYGFMANEAHFAAGSTYFRAYHQAFPFAADQLEAAFLAHFGKRTFSLWVEREHYLQNNRRVDTFLTSEKTFLSYFAENFESFVARIIREIFI